MSVEDVGEILLNPLLFLMLQFFFFSGCGFEARIFR